MLGTAMHDEIRSLYETPAYGLVEAAHYLRVPYQTLRYWLTGFNRMPPMIKMASNDPPRLSFINLLECHVLSAMRSVYDLRLPKVRRGLANLAKYTHSVHPLVDQQFFTDKADLFIQQVDTLVNLSRGGQLAIPETLEAHLQRIERDPQGLFKFFPFVRERSLREPKFILIDPSIGFGKPVITGTGISTAVIAARFEARESIRDLAEEYGRPEQEIEEAVRWETIKFAA